MLVTAITSKVKYIIVFLFVADFAIPGRAKPHVRDAEKERGTSFAKLEATLKVMLV